MDLYELSPYIRLASYSLIQSAWELKERILFDYELIYIDQGCMSLTVEGTEHLCPEGTVILLRPNQPHRIRNATTEMLSQPHVHFDLRYQADSREVYVNFENYDALSEEKRSLIREDLLAQWELTLPVISRLANAGEIRALLFGLIDKWEARQPFYELDCKADLLRLLTLLLRAWNPGTGASDNNAFSDSRELSHIKNFISRNYNQKITLTSLSQQFHISKFYLTRRFKEVYGKSVIEYLSAVRLERARLFLRNENLNITDIARMTGFSSVYVFSRFFKEHMGMSPLQFRQALLAEEPELRDRKEGKEGKEG